MICPTRQDDERVLAWLKMRKTQPSAAIGAAFATTGATVRVACNRVRDDDLAYSGERTRDVLTGYSI